MQSETHNPVEACLEKNSVTSAIMKLNTNDRKLIILYYYQELAIKEIALIIGHGQKTLPFNA